jgi:tetratricopeptide (TPR) repeat protein
MKADLIRSSNDNEAVYEELVTVIEANQGVLALLIAVCDDLNLRDGIIQRYEQELQPAFQPYRLQLAQAEPSLRAALVAWAEQQDQPSPAAVLTVTGAENLLWFKLEEDDPRTEIEKFFGYLQWGREGLREFPYPIVLWITQRILKDLSLKAPDFWSWRKGVFRFVSDAVTDRSSLDHDGLLSQKQTIISDSFLLPLKDLQELIATIEQREGPEAPLLGTLYSRLAQVYRNRVEQGKAEDLQKERDLVIANYEKAIAIQTKQNQGSSAIVTTLINLGRFYFFQGYFQDVISVFQQSLKISQEINDRIGEAASLSGLGNAAYVSGRYPEAIAFYEKSLQIQRELGDRTGEAASLLGLGNAAYVSGRYPEAIAFYEKSLQIQRELGDRTGEASCLDNMGNVAVGIKRYSEAIIYYKQALQIQRELGDRYGEANSLGNLGIVYKALEQYSEAITFYEQSLQINHEIGDYYGEAILWFNLGSILVKVNQISDALEAYYNARQLYTDTGLEKDVQDCDNAIKQITSAF